MKQVGNFKFSCFNRNFLKKAHKLMEEKNLILTQKYYDDKLSGIFPKLEMSISYDEEDEDIVINLIYTSGGIYSLYIDIYYDVYYDFKPITMNTVIEKGYKNPVLKIDKDIIDIRPYDDNEFNEVIDFYDNILPKIDESIKKSYLYNTILDYKKKKVGK